MPHPTIEQLLKKLRVQFPKADLGMVELAYDYAVRAHHGQLRTSGEPYINHCLACTINLTAMRVDLATIQAGLLHDVPEETSYTVEDIKENFGPEVASLVEGITKLGKLKYRGMERYVENLRKMFLALSQDIRVILIKFADRIHNLETLNALAPEKQKRIALESMEIFAPLAHRLGMWEIKGQLEDLSFKYLEPEEYAWVSKLVTENAPAKEKNLERAVHQLKRTLAKELNLKIIRIEGRAKHLYSLHKKLLRHNRELDQIYDLIAGRVVVETVAECYMVLGIIHQLWKPLRGRIKDYIAQPKPNGYQSLHTTVFVGPGQIIEFQIRTKAMDDEATYGIAAHWYYTEKGKPKQGTTVGREQQLHWVSELLKLQHEVKDTSEYLESVKINLFDDHIFVFTPTGDVIDLPEAATPVDFAYHIHSDVGHGCTAARVNNIMVPLSTMLKSGDVVEIVVDKKRKPSRDWLQFVKTRNAREHIKQALNQTSKYKLRFWQS